MLFFDYKPHPRCIHNGRKAYQINYRNEWKKGYAQKRIDSLLKVLPQLKQAGTIHTQEDLLKIPAALVTGGHFNPDLKHSDFGLEFLFGAGMYGKIYSPALLLTAAATVGRRHSAKTFIPIPFNMIILTV